MEFTNPKRTRSVQVAEPTKPKSHFEQMADILRPDKSVVTMTAAELNKIDSYQDANRGFKESAKDERRNW
jgi:hypothetical protein